MDIQVLIIDDDESLIELLKKYLGRHGISVISAIRPDPGLQLLERHKPALVILDVMLPDKDGFQVCREIRAAGDTPVIMLTARGEVADRVVGFEMGADDYLPKPFEPRELVARIQAVLKRAGSRQANGRLLKCDKLSLNVETRVARLGGRPLELTTTEFDILAFFMKNSGAVLTRDRIVEQIHGAGHEAFQRSVDLAVSRLRQKLGDSPEKEKFIKTIWGSGYFFLGRVERHEA
jgi:DNA-binding response OmpR family regulator